MRNSTLLKWAQAGSAKGGGGGGAGAGPGPAASSASNGTGGTGAGAAGPTGKDGSRSWLHPADALQRGHIAYLVKFLGSTEVAQAKGILVVKEAIRKLRFNQQLRKAEGSKTPKVELTVSIDGVAIQEPKSKRILHQYPLHRISYCADDKGEKRFFSFIAKEAESEQHSCFVFVSEKLAEEITLTIGQAFDLAYRRFVETSGRDLEVQRRLMLLQQRALRWEAEARELRRRLEALVHLVPQAELDSFLSREGLNDLLAVELPNLPAPVASTSASPPPASAAGAVAGTSPGAGSGSGSSGASALSPSYDLLGSSGLSSSGSSHGPAEPLLDLSGSPSAGNNGVPCAPPVPPRAFQADARAFLEHGCLGGGGSSGAGAVPSVGTRLEGLLLEELEAEDDDDFDPRAFESSRTGAASSPLGEPEAGQRAEEQLAAGPPTPAPRLAPPPKMARDSRRAHNGSGSAVENPFKEDLFGSAPFNPPAGSGGVTGSPGADPFGMGAFSGGKDLQNAIGLLDKRLLEMNDGFSRGLSFGNDDFSIESLDPLRQ